MLQDIPKEVLQELWKVRATLHVHLMAARAMSGFEQEVQGGILQQLAQLIDDGKIKRIDTQTFAGGLEDMPQAQEAQAKSGKHGKVVVAIKK